MLPEDTSPITGLSERRSNPKQVVAALYKKYGQSKKMGVGSSSHKHPVYFLHRTFLGENDLLIIFNTRRCQFNCPFCSLPHVSADTDVSWLDVVEQFLFVLLELKHSLSVLDRVTLSNNGSFLDQRTMPRKSLLSIAEAINELRRVRRLVLETRLCFMDEEFLRLIQHAAKRSTIDILTGFETKDPAIREKILGKNESLEAFLQGLDQVAAQGVAMTAYVLYKPGPAMSDREAFHEALSSARYLKNECHHRGIPLTIRLNPMYAARGTRWAALARDTTQYKPPKLTDVMKLAEVLRREGIAVYIGLSTEGGAEDWGSYLSREDYSRSLIRQVKLFNDARILTFNEVN